MRAQNNDKIRKHAADKRIFLYEIASEMGVSIPTLYNRLNRKLSDEQEAEMIGIIDKLAAARK